MAGESNGRLVSWKEIAAYLGCDIRTCMRWEKERGLPVLRPGGQPGPRVYAWKHELDAWLAGKALTADAGSLPENTTAGPTPPSSLPSRVLATRVGRRHLVPIGLVALAALVWLGFKISSRDLEPADFTIDGPKLITLNKAQKPIGAFKAGPEDLDPESLYRTAFQTRLPDPRDPDNGILYASRLAFVDLEEDGRKEALFVPHARGSNSCSLLYCLDPRGRPLWSAPFKGGRAMVFGQKPYSDDYFLSFETMDLDGDAKKEILAFAEQNDDWPTQLVVLSSSGRILGEYWNSGRITCTAHGDLDGDGRHELIIGGVNSEYGKAFLAIFDPGRISGSSPNSGDYASPSLKEGSELAYILFPRTDIDTEVDDIHTVLGNLKILQNGRLRAQISRTNLQLEIDPQSLSCLDLTLANKFRLLHKTAVEQGRIRSTLDDAYRERIKRDLSYWTGQEWTPIPTWVRPKP
jgi:hypothetical protein